MKFAKKLLAGVLAAAITFSCFITLSYATDGGDGGATVPEKTVTELFIEGVNAVDFNSANYAELKTKYDDLTAKKDDEAFDLEFEGVADAIVKYDALGSIVEEYVSFNEAFIALANEVDLSGDYDTLKAKYDELTAKKADPKFNAEFAGMADADAKYTALQAAITKYDYNAAFITSVNALDLSSADYAYLKAQYDELTVKMADSKFDTDFTDMAVAIEKYEALGEKIEGYIGFSESFISSAALYDPNSADYEYMVRWRNNLEMLFAKASVTYPGMTEAVDKYNALKAKIVAIDANAQKFITAVSQMQINKANAVSASAPYLTTNFTDLYAKYSTAMSVYANGTVHPSLDPATYPGLTEKISAFAGANGFKAYVEARLLDCETFVGAIEKAASSSNYVSILAELDKAALYLDTNVDKSLENHGDVAEAVALYATLRAALAQSVADANAYIAAVNAIDMNASYTALKNAVNAARALQEKGDVTGVAGVAEANIKFSAADAKVVSLEGNSKTLKDAVAALKEAKTIAERRELIFIANNAKAKAEDTITGVTEAKAELATLVEAFNADVAAANAELFTAVKGVSVVAAAAVTSQNVCRTIDVVNAMLK